MVDRDVRGTERGLDLICGPLQRARPGRDACCGFRVPSFRSGTGSDVEHALFGAIPEHGDPIAAALVGEPVGARHVRYHSVVR